MIFLAIVAIIAAGVIYALSHRKTSKTDLKPTVTVLPSTNDGPVAPHGQPYNPSTGKIETP